MIKNPEDSFTGGPFPNYFSPSAAVLITLSLLLATVSTTLRQAGGPAGGQFQEASVVSGMAHRACTMWCTVEAVEGARLGPNVPSATAVCSAASIFFFYLPIPSQSAVQQHCTNKLPRLVSLKVSTFLQRHCCCLSQGVKGPRPSFLSTLRAANWKQDMVGVGGVPIS